MPAPVRPGIAGQDPCDRLEAKLTAAAASVVRVPGLAQVPEQFKRHLALHHPHHRPPHRLVASRDDILAGIPWPGEITLRHGTARDEARDEAGSTITAAITGAFAAVAETGSIVLCSHARSPTTLGFLPEDHIVVLGTDQIVPYMEDVWERIGTRFATWPRAVHFITGPSRTADIEQTMQLGAHGPRRLMVILVEDSGPLG